MASTELNAGRRDLGVLAPVSAEATDRYSVWKAALKDWDTRETQIVLEWQAEARAETRVEERASAVIVVLQAKFQFVPQDSVKAIQSLSDAERLARLIRVAAKAESAEQFRVEAGL